MPSWDTVLQEIQGQRVAGNIDVVRRKYLGRLAKYTGRNVIAYYSGWLAARQPMSPAYIVNDEDKNGFMAAIKGLDRDHGLDLILHTPGGESAATESLVDYLRQMFGINIRAIVPQLAMSAGTMIACACSELVMGKQSNLGPIDPQFNGIPANGVLDEFKEAVRQIKADPATTPLWREIIGKYHPSFLGICKNAVRWSETIVTDWLKTGMFCGDPEAEEKARAIVRGLSDTNETFNHARHIPVSTLESLDMNVKRLEDDDKLQDLVLTVHHAFMHTFSMTPCLKIIENHKGVMMGRIGKTPSTTRALS